MANKFHVTTLQAWATILNDRDDAAVLEGRNYQVCVCERECVCVYDMPAVLDPLTSGRCVCVCVCLRG